MERPHEIELADFVDYPHTDWISGREFGEDKAKKIGLLNWVKSREKVIIHINDEKVKAINDSFIKGFFSAIFKEVKSKEQVNKLFTIEANPYFARLFEKNFKILDAIYNNATPNSK
jgi:hypothetical protein